MNNSYYNPAPVPENAGICPDCGKHMIKHIIQEGARFHVIRWGNTKNGALSECSEPDCEHNHGPGHCIPLAFKPPTPSDICPFCNGTGQKRWGKLGMRACVKCKGSGKK